MQRYTLKLNIQIFFYFFIENLCFCSLKIAVCVLKITIESKNCRLKITAESKNYYLKIIARVRVYARMYARMYGNSHQDTRPRPAQHRTRNTAGKGRTQAKHTNKICFYR